MHQAPALRGGGSSHFMAWVDFLKPLIAFTPKYGVTLRG
jgi:hypothetical protein